MKQRKNRTPVRSFADTLLRSEHCPETLICEKRLILGVGAVSPVERISTPSTFPVRGDRPADGKEENPFSTAEPPLLLQLRLQQPHLAAHKRFMCLNFLRSGGDTTPWLSEPLCGLL